jgi:hypothetical protein
MSGSPNSRQNHFRIRLDGKIVASTPTWGAAEDGNWFPGLDAPFRVRFAIDNTGGAGSGNLRIWCRKNGGTAAQVTTTSTVVRSVDDSATGTGGAIATGTFRLTAGAGAAVAGLSSEIGTGGTCAAASYNEIEHAIMLRSADLTAGDVVELLIGLDGGTTFASYNQIPTITIPAADSAPSGTTTYQLSNTASDLTGETVNKQLATSGSAGTWAAQALTANNSNTADSVADASFFTPAGVPGANGGSNAGKYSTVSLDITTGNTNVRYSARIIRVNSSGVVQAYGPLSAESSAGTTGIYTFNCSWNGLGTWVSGDRLRLDVRARNNTTSSSQSFTLTYASANSSIAFIDAAASATGDLSATLGALTVSSTGVQGAPVGSLSKTLDALTASSTGSAPAKGDLSQTLGAVTLASAGGAPQTVGTLSATLGALSLSSTGAAPAVGAASPTLDALSLSATGAVAAETWNPSDKHADIVLSNGNLTATKSGSDNSTSVRGETARGGSTEWFFEVTITEVINVAVGVANSSFVLNGWPGDDTNACALYSNGDLGYGGYIDYGNLNNGDVVGVHWKPATGDVLFYVNGSLFASQATSLTSVYPLLEAYSNGDGGTANFGATAFTFQPSGTTSWDGSQVAGAAAVGTLTATLDAVTASAVGAAPAVGTATPTLGAVSLTATGAAPSVGTVSATLGAVTLAAAGAASITGAVSQTLGAVTLSATGAAPVVGAFSQTLGTISLTSAGASPAVGSLSATLGAVALSSAGAAAAPVGSLSQTLGALTLSSAGLVSVRGTATATLGTLTAASAGVAPTVAQAAITLGSVTLGAAGVAPVVGAASITLSSLSLFATSGTPQIFGAVSATLSDATLTASGAAPTVGVVTGTLGALTLAGTASAPAKGTLGTTLASVAVIAAGVAPSAGSLSKALDSLTISATGDVQGQSAGDLAVTLGAVSLSATARAPAAGAFSKTLDTLTVSATGDVQGLSVGDLAVTLDALVVSATGAAQAQAAGSLSVTLADLTGSAAGTAPVAGIATLTLTSLTLVASDAARLPPARWVEVTGRVSSAQTSGRAYRARVIGRMNKKAA